MLSAPSMGAVFLPESAGTRSEYYSLFGDILRNSTRLALFKLRTAIFARNSSKKKFLAKTNGLSERSLRSIVSVFRRFQQDLGLRPTTR